MFKETVLIFILINKIGFVMGKWADDACVNVLCSEKYPCVDTTKTCTGFPGYSRCCDWSKLPCAETGLYSYAWRSGKAETGIMEHIPYRDEIHTYEVNDNWYHKVDQYRNESIVIPCPIPISYIFSEIGNFIRAVDFSVNENGSITPPKQCSSSIHCDYGEFCGTTYNPYQCGNEVQPCLDKSGQNGTSKIFCYQAPKYRERAFIAIRDDVDMMNCDKTEDCLIDNLYCDTTKPNKRMINGIVYYYKGICVRAKVCNAKEDTNILGKMSDSGSICTIGNDSSCIEENARCISSPYLLDHHKLSFCCTSRPEKPLQQQNLTLISTHQNRRSCLVSCLIILSLCFVINILFDGFSILFLKRRLKFIKKNKPTKKKTKRKEKKDFKTGHKLEKNYSKTNK